MPGEWLELVGTGIGSAGAGAGITGWVGRKKRDAETESTSVDSAKQVVEMALELLQPMQKKIDDLTQMTEELSARVKHLEDENTCLRQQLEYLEDDGR